MKARNVFLIGDSTCYGDPPFELKPGYGRYVREMLNDQAEVNYPDENCRFAQYTLRYLHEWASKVDRHAVDVVHWNNGLWDVLQLYNDEPLTPLDMYVDTLRRVYKRIRLLFPNAKVIFAMSLPANEDVNTVAFARFNAVVDQYNDAAKKLMDELHVPVNDLHAVAPPYDENYLAPDHVHLNEKGSRILASAVIQAIDAL